MIGRYARWLHTRWPAGWVEKLPQLRADGSTAVPGVYVVGDLTGVPLLKFALETGARVARAVADRLAARPAGVVAGSLDVIVIGGGVGGMAAAVEARKRGLSVQVVEASEPFSTLVNFPRAKPIYTYPSSWVPAGDLQVSATVKEDLVVELKQQVERAGVTTLAGRAERVERSGEALRVHLAGGPVLDARAVIVAIGRSGNFRRLGVPGEDLDKVFNRLHDPGDFAGRDVLVVGGGDSAVETTIALADAGARVTLCHRGTALTRPKPQGLAAIERLAAEGKVRLRTRTRAHRIDREQVILEDDGGRRESIANDVVFTMIGREAPLEFFRRSGLPIAGESTPLRWAAFGLFLAFCAWLYDWKSGGVMAALWYRRQWFPTNLPALLARAGDGLAAAAADPRTLIGTLAISAAAPAFWYTLAYSAVIVIFGVRRIRRRRTPYVTAQTACLMAIQVLPLFVLPEVVLPLLHHNGLLPRGLADALFPVASYGHGREFWRAYGLILAWPLNVYNLFTHDPLGWWIAIAVVQTLVLIPLAVYFFGKGAYCGWICSCGALAETLGDLHRHKMPHGPAWNRLNLAGQGVLAIATLLLAARVAGWVLPEGNALAVSFDGWKEHYKWIIDVFLAGVVGYGCYFWFSGRVWCRFFCPLAALMHVYARLGRFAIVAEKKKCISCNVCTAVCHQGIDVMSFANRGAPMIDPQCVRCSACVHSCPTGVLQFGQVRRDGSLISVDSLAASPVRMREAREPSTATGERLASPRPGR